MYSALPSGLTTPDLLLTIWYIFFWNYNCPLTFSNKLFTILDKGIKKQISLVDVLLFSIVSLLCKLSYNINLNNVIYYLKNIYKSLNLPKNYIFGQKY